MNCFGLTKRLAPSVGPIAILWVAYHRHSRGSGNPRPSLILESRMRGIDELLSAVDSKSATLTGIETGDDVLSLDRDCRRC